MRKHQNIGDDDVYSNCIKCLKLGSICKGPNFTDMTMPDLIDWMKSRKAYLGWTSTTLAERSRVPEGTVKRVLAAEDGGFKYDTIAPLLQALTGSSRAELPCPDPDGSIEEKLTSRIRHLEQELADTKTISDREANHLHHQIRNHRIALSLITGILILVLLGIIGILVYDLTHPGIGYFGW